jgi:hypothetical protein
MCLDNFDTTALTTLQQNAAAVGIAGTSCNKACPGDATETCGAQNFKIPAKLYNSIPARIRLVSIYSTTVTCTQPPTNPCATLNQVGCFLGQAVSAGLGLVNLAGLPDLLNTDKLVVGTFNQPAFIDSAADCQAACTLAYKTAAAYIVLTQSECICASALHRFERSWHEPGDNCSVPGFM